MCPTTKAIRSTSSAVCTPPTAPPASSFPISESRNPSILVPSNRRDRGSESVPAAADHVGEHGLFGAVLPGRAGPGHPERRLYVLRVGAAFQIQRADHLPEPVGKAVGKFQFQHAGCASHQRGDVDVLLYLEG